MTRISIIFISTLNHPLGSLLSPSFQYCSQKPLTWSEHNNNPKRDHPNPLYNIYHFKQVIQTSVRTSEFIWKNKSIFYTVLDPSVSQTRALSYWCYMILKIFTFFLYLFTKASPFFRQTLLYFVLEGTMRLCFENFVSWEHTLAESWSIFKSLYLPRHLVRLGTSRQYIFLYLCNFQFISEFRPHRISRSDKS